MPAAFSESAERRTANTNLGILSATAGSTRMARRAGITHAMTAAASRRRQTAANVRGSVERTPNSWLSTQRDAANAASSPIAAPQATRRRPSPRIIDRISRGRAPSARRMPISVRRCPARCAITPYRPTAASSSAVPPNRPTSVAIMRCGAMDWSKTLRSLCGRTTTIPESTARTAARIPDRSTSGSPCAARTCSATPDS